MEVWNWKLAFTHQTGGKLPVRGKKWPNRPVFRFFWRLHTTFDKMVLSHSEGIMRRNRRENDALALFVVI